MYGICEESGTWVDERSHNISHAEDTSSELVSNGASACKRLLDAVAKVQQLWVFCNLYKSLNKPQQVTKPWDADQAHSIPQNPKLP